MYVLSGSPCEQVLYKTALSTQHRSNNQSSLTFGISTSVSQTRDNAVYIAITLTPNCPAPSFSFISMSDGSISFASEHINISTSYSISLCMYTRVATSSFQNRETPEILVTHLFPFFFPSPSTIHSSPPLFPLLSFFSPIPFLPHPVPKFNTGQHDKPSQLLSQN